MRITAAFAPLLVVLLTGCPTGPADDDDDVVDPTEVQVSDVQWRVHDDMGSILVVSWQQLAAADTWLEFSFDEGEWSTSPPISTAAGAAEQLLLGVPYGTDVTFRVVNEFGSGPLATEDHAAATGELPANFPTLEVLVADAARYEPTGRYLLGSVNRDEGGWVPGDYWAFVIDRQGRVVWSRLTPDRNFTIYLRVSADGDDILLDEATFWSEFDGGAASRVYRLKIDGSVVVEYETPGLHHAYTDLPDGSLVWGSAVGFDEHLVKLNSDGSSEILWVCSEYLTEIDFEVWCQSNTLTWVEATDTFLVSFYTMHSILELDHATGDVVHSWGQLPGSWGFDPPGSQFWFQHGCSYTDSGTLMTSSHRSEDDYTGVVREYEIDEDEGLLREVWSFGTDGDIVLDKAGEAHRLANGNTLHNYGSAGRLLEVTPDGEVVWDVTWNGEHLLGRTVLVGDLYAFVP
jgi:hypothetical protein